MLLSPDPPWRAFVLPATPPSLPLVVAQDQEEDDDNDLDDEDDDLIPEPAQPIETVDDFKEDDFDDDFDDDFEEEFEDDENTPT